MKFHDLPIGQRFEFEGEAYVKTGPFVASHGVTGAQKFMARYAMVIPAGAQAAPAPKSRERMIQRTAAEAAFEGFYQRCMRMMTDLGLPEGRLDAALGELADGRQAFLDSLRGCNSDQAVE